MDSKENGRCTHRIAIGIMMMSILLAGSAGAETISVDGSIRAGFLKIHDAINSDYEKNSVSSIDHNELNRFAIQDTSSQTSNACAVMCHYYKTEPITGDSFPNANTTFNRRETFLGILSERPSWANITDPNIEFRWDPSELDGNKWDYFLKTRPFHYDESGHANFKLRNFSQDFVEDGTYAVDLISRNEFPGFSISRVVSNGGLISESGNYTINVTVMLYESSEHISIRVELWQNDLLTAKLTGWSASSSPNQNDTGSNNEWVNIGYDQPLPVQYNFNVTYHVNKILPANITYKPRVWVERNTAGQGGQAGGPSKNISIQSNQFGMNSSFSSSNPVLWSYSETVIKRAELKEMMEVQDPAAQFSFNKDFVVATGNDSLDSGMYDRRIRYGMDIFNGGDASGTVLGELRFATQADNITYLDWGQYATWNRTAASWNFPPNFKINENSGFGAGYFNTNHSESRLLNASIDRWMNKTVFNNSEYQLLKFNVTFPNTDFKWAWVHVDANDRYEVSASIVRGTFAGEAPGNFDESEHGAHFNFDMNWIRPGVAYSFSILVKVNLTGNAAPPIRYKPRVSVGMGRYYNSTGAKGFDVSIPHEMLPDNIHQASASTNVSNAWLLKRHNHDIAELSDVSELAGPHAVFVIEKHLSVSTDNDSLHSGMYMPHVGHPVGIFNQFDDSNTVLGDIGFSADADNITGVNFGQYATWNKTSVTWKFPSDYTIYENNGFSAGFDTNYSEPMFLNASIDRWMNRTEFNREGYQLSKFNITFSETGFQWIWADIYAVNLQGVNVSIVPGTFTTSAPGDFGVSHNEVYFNFDMNLIRPGITYNFSAVLKVVPAIERASQIHYKPAFGVGMGLDYNYGNGGSGYTVKMPPSMLPEHVTRATATTNIFNAWQVQRNNQVAMWLETDITPPAITNFSILPKTPLNKSKPGRAFADIADANLAGVMFGVIDANNLVDDNMTLIGFSVNMSGVNGRYSSPEWYPKIWGVTNGTAQDIVTVIDWQDDMQDDLLVEGMFKKNSTASEEFALMWFNINKTSPELGQLSNLTYRDLSTITIESGSSTFTTSKSKFIKNNPPVPVDGLTFTLYTIGSADNPYFVSTPVPTGVYQAFVRAGDISGNENVLFADFQVDNLVSFPGQTGLPTDPDGDGLYEDLNGNGRKDFNDVVLFFNNLEWISGNEPTADFDFNRNSRIDFADIVRLFEEV